MKPQTKQAGRVTPCAPAPNRASDGARRRDVPCCSWFIYLALAAATVLIYWQVHSFEFVNYDDTDYVKDNLTVQRGLTWENIRWAFTTYHASNWHPVTWLSHMLDCTLFGVKPGAHHATNLFLHVANTLLLFALLKQSTGAIWRSAFVAAAFALHPLHVESVAWIAERKDVLSTCFFFLTLFAYRHYVRKPSPGIYLLVAFLFALGVMAKPMLVTLPFVLLLLDFWPLQRFQLETQPVASKRSDDGNSKLKVVGRLFLEKLPLLALSLVVSSQTVAAQKSWGAVQSVSQIPIADRVANAVLTYLRYLEKMFWPTKLAIPYVNLPLESWHIAVAAVVILTISVAALKFARSHPYFLSGWLWYLGTLVPVIGLVQVGSQSMADRYTYIPLIGIFWIIAWGTNDFAANWANGKVVLSTTATLVLLACVLVSWKQIGVWRNTETLFTHSTRVLKGNYFAHYNLGNWYYARGKAQQAAAQYQAAVDAKPDYANALNNLGNALGQLGRTNEAAAAYERALKISGGGAMARVNLANSLAAAGKLDEAIQQYQEALRTDPDSVEGHNGLGVAFANKGNFPAAISEFHAALKTNPKSSDAQRNLEITVRKHSEAENDGGLALAMTGKVEEALPRFRAAIRIDPKNAAAHANLGNALGVLDKTDEAITAFETSVKLDPKDPQTRLNLSIALTKLSRRDEAISQLREALRLKPDYIEAQRQLDELTRK